MKKSNTSVNPTGSKSFKRGVLTIAHSKEKYVRQAINLARSIRLHSPQMPLAVATNLSASALEDYFDEVVYWNFSNLTGLVAKLDAYDMSPFETTLFIDADSLVVKPLEDIFEYFNDYDFAVYGINKVHPRWFLDLDKIKEIIPSNTYPGFNGGIYYFKKTDQARGIFQSAKSYLPAYDNLMLKRFGSQPNEEPLISLAMAQSGLQATDNGYVDIMFAPAGRKGKLQIDVLAGICSFRKNDRVVHPYIMHFASDDMCYEYLREERRLQVYASGQAISQWKESWICSQIWLKWLFIRFIPLYSTFTKNKLKSLFQRESRYLSGGQAL